MKPRVFISIETRDRDAAVVKHEHDQAVKDLLEHGFIPVNPLEKNAHKLPDRVMLMNGCDFIYHTNGWMRDRVCKYEDYIANLFEIKRIKLNNHE